MIRFLDKEIYCVTYNTMDRNQLLYFFLDDHIKDVICVLNEANEFFGIITYTSLLGNNLEDSIMREYVVLDENLFRNCKKYFDIFYGKMNELPILNRQHQLVCFAWNDNEANRELRMLDELSECNEALDFKDVYPMYDIVTIYGCNELAWKFLQYLHKINIQVQTKGEIWGEFGGVFNEENALNYKNMIVYAEGNGMIEGEGDRLLNSVSEEFECIEKIYEENICKGIIKDVDGNFDIMLSKLKGKKIGIIGVDSQALDAYDLLLEYGIDVCCFIFDNADQEILFGKRILSFQTVREEMGEIVLIEPYSKYSAWGNGGVDFYHYRGYRRNQTYFLIQDYVEIPQNGWMNVVAYTTKQMGRRIVLIGDIWQCIKYNQFVSQKTGVEMVYLNLLGISENYVQWINKVREEDINVGDIILLILPRYYGCYTSEKFQTKYSEQLKEKYINKLNKYGRSDVINISLDKSLNLNKYDGNNCMQIERGIKVRKIIIGSSSTSSGNVFFRNLLDGHPDMLILDEGYLNMNLYDICLRISVKQGDDILSLFWELYDAESPYFRIETESEELIDRKLFEQNLSELIHEKETYTSQELFVIIHIAYAKIWNKDVTDIENKIIYWEPHIASKEMTEEYAIWLKEICCEGTIINITRNSYIRAGSFLKNVDLRNALYNDGEKVCSAIFKSPNFEGEYSGWKKIYIKFEDLKCDPIRKLNEICDELNIDWSDTLLKTTSHGKQSYFRGVTGFDLAPVFSNYEEYLSEFDRFRILMITGPWQKEHGYPYVSSLDFSRIELREMFLKKFRFEDKLLFANEEEKNRFRKRIWRKIIRQYLQIVRRYEILMKMSK